MAKKTPKIERYAIVQNGETVNVVLWDGVTDITLPPNCTLVKEANAPAYEPDEQVAE